MSHKFVMMDSFTTLRRNKVIQAFKSSDGFLILAALAADVLFRGVLQEHYENSTLRPVVISLQILTIFFIVVRISIFTFKSDLMTAADQFNDFSNQIADSITHIMIIITLYISASLYVVTLMSWRFLLMFTFIIVIISQIRVHILS